MMVTRSDLSAESIQDAAVLIRRGGVVAFPDEHVYLLLADAFHLSATARIRELRMMELGQTLQVLIPALPTLHGLARQVEGEGLALAEKFWPGPLALFVLAQSGLSWDLGDEREQGAFLVRQPRDESLRTLLRETGPLACALATRAGESWPHQVAEISLAEELDLIVDGGVRDAQANSTVVDITSTPPKLLRRGSITLKELAKVATTLLVE